MNKGCKTRPQGLFLFRNSIFTMCPQFGKSVNNVNIPKQKDHRSLASAQQGSPSSCLGSVPATPPLHQPRMLPIYLTQWNKKIGICTWFSYFMYLSSRVNCPLDHLSRPPVFMQKVTRRILVILLLQKQRWRELDLRDLCAVFTESRFHVYIIMTMEMQFTGRITLLEFFFLAQLSVFPWVSNSLVCLFA